MSLQKSILPSQWKVYGYQQLQRIFLFVCSAISIQCVLNELSIVFFLIFAVFAGEALIKQYFVFDEIRTNKNKKTLISSITTRLGSKV